MRRLARLWVLLLVPLAGCGTVQNLNGVNVDNAHPWLGRRTTPYGGVVYDANSVARHAKQLSTFRTSAAIADIPFSLVGDTMTLPWTIGRHR